jgi:predicted Zn-dependent protease with MMP-like domain
LLEFELSKGYFPGMKPSRLRLNRKEFDRVVQRAYNRIPKEIRKRLGDVVLTVRKRPTLEMLEEVGCPLDEPLLGIYWGASLREHSFFDAPPLYPDTIYIFQEPLEEMCETLDELEREIEITVVHEVAHFLGISEDRLEELGYG